MGTHLYPKGNHKRPYKREAGEDLPVEERGNVTMGVRCSAAGSEDGGRSHEPRGAGYLYFYFIFY